MESAADAGRITSVAPPGFAPPVAVPEVAPAPTGADAAVRWRINAAVLDNVIVYGAYLGLCVLLHWRIADPAHLPVFLVAGVAYHFVLEARDGQTVGKRRFGIRVVSADGGPASVRAVGLRSVLRIVDQFPVCYVSGLVSMVRTGPARRQRIGDLAGRTMVVAVDREAASKGTSRWVLPVATLIALIISGFSVYAVANAGNQPFNQTQRSAFIAGCQRSAGTFLNCGCLLTQLEAAGYDTPNKILTMVTAARSARAAGNTAPSPALVAARACRR